MPIPDFVLRLREKVGHDLFPMTGATGVQTSRTHPPRAVPDTGDWALPSRIINLRGASPSPANSPGGRIVRPEAPAAVSTTEEVVYPNGDRRPTPTSNLSLHT